MILYSHETGSREVGSDGEFPPTFRDVGSTEGDPYDESTFEPMGLKKLSRWFGIDSLKLHELYIFSENPFHPTEARSSLKWHSIYMTMIPEILVVYGRSGPIIGVIFREFRTFYELHDFRENRVIVREYRDKNKISKKLIHYISVICFNLCLVFLSHSTFTNVFLLVFLCFFVCNEKITLLFLFIC